MKKLTVKKLTVKRLAVDTGIKAGGTLVHCDLTAFCGGTIPATRVGCVVTGNCQTVPTADCISVNG